MGIFFTADTHFFHRNIIKYCQRPFASPQEMNRAMITIWNRQVKKEDSVYHLGDVSFGGLSETFRLLAELNGTIYLICGNHDDELCADSYLVSRFAWIKPYAELVINGQEIVMCHYPIVQWRNAQRGAWHLYGHTHGSIRLRGRAMDVGIDAHPSFQLWRWIDIAKHMHARKNLPYPAKPNYPKRVLTRECHLISSQPHQPAGKHV